MKMTRIVLSAIVSVCLFMLAGCQNTVEGFGKDMQNTGKKIEKSSQE